MPKETKFDIDKALNNAAQVFRAKGYEATSMADLTHRMGINKGSLYNTFANKKELFKRALHKFEQNTQTPILQKLSTLDDPTTAIATLFDTVIAQSLADPKKRGCLIANTTQELPNHDPDITHLIRATLSRQQAFFHHMIERGQQQNTIPTTIDPKETAQALVTLMTGLHILSRGTFDTDGLLAIKKSALKLIAT